MKETNELIAEFMDMNNDVPHDKTMMVFKTEQGNDVISINDLTYHSDWNELMKVVDRIESICINSTEMAVRLDGSSYLWYWDANELSHSYDPDRHIVSTSNRNYVYVCGSVDNVHQAVVEFIKFYNQNK